MKPERIVWHAKCIREWHRELTLKRMGPIVNTRQRYYHLRHTERLLLWQIAQAEKEMARIKLERRDTLRRIRMAHKNVKLGIRAVINANVAYYNRAVRSAHGY